MLGDYEKRRAEWLEYAKEYKRCPPIFREYYQKFIDDGDGTPEELEGYRKILEGSNMDWICDFVEEQLTPRWAIKCACGDVTERKIKYSPGIYFGSQCPGCNRILISQIPGKRKYSRKDTEARELAILEIFAEEYPRLTVRRVYYALTVKGVVPKTEAGYRQAQYTLATMRRSGALPYGWIADNTRWQRKPITYTGLQAALERWQEAYRRDLWANSDRYVEIWVEKDALAGVIYPITEKYDVPLMVARGYSSMSFIHDAAEYLKEIDKPVYVYHFGDFDASGVNAAEKIRDGLLEHGADIYFKRVAITYDQVMDLDLVTRPNKGKDPRSKKWPYPFSCELDALPTPTLRQMVNDCIESHIDDGRLEFEQTIEDREKETLAAVLENFVQEQKR